MSKCLKCGAELPPVGECPACAAAAVADTLPSGTPVPSLLDKDIHIDRRKTPERTPAVTEPAVPSFADLARGQPAPPGLAPARPAAPAQPPAMTPAPRTQTPAMGLPAQAAPQPPGMTPSHRPPPPPSMPAAQAAVRPQVVPPPNRIPVPSPASVPVPQRIPMPGAQAAQHVPPPGAPVPPAPAPMPAQAAPPAPAALSQAAAGDPDDTAPGQPSFASKPTPPSAPSAMASPAQRAELPVPSAPPPAPPLAPEPNTASRQQRGPVEVVTFSPPSRLPVPPPHAVLPTDEQMTPRLPMPLPPPLAPQPPAQQRERPSSAPGTQEIHARPASLWRRMLSFTIDTAALVGVAALYITLASSIAGVKKPSSQGLTALDSMAVWMHALKSVLLPGAVLLVVLAAVYCAVAAFLWNGRTLGRLLLGLRLVDTHGVAPAPTRAIVRAILSVVSFGLFLGGFWMALFDKRGQTLHDKLTSTFVIQPS